jgi:hypothetical protein
MEVTYLWPPWLSGSYHPRFEGCAGGCVDLPNFDGSDSFGYSNALSRALQQGIRLTFYYGTHRPPAVKSLSRALYISLVILHTKKTGRHESDFTAHG